MVKYDDDDDSHNNAGGGADIDIFQPITQFSTSATTGNTNGNIGNAGVFTLGEFKSNIDETVRFKA